MMRLFLMVAAALLLMLGLSTNVQAKVLGYKEWRSQRIQAALTDVIKIKTEIELKRSGVESLSGVQGTGAPSTDDLIYSMRKNLLLGLNKRLSQSELRLETEKSLTVNDYFILYLSSQSDKKQAFDEALNGLSREEMVELLLAYDRKI